MALINFSGIASGIDTEALIKASSDATRATQVSPLEDKITELTDTNDALDQLKTKLATLRTALQAMATLSGGALVKQVSSSSETLVTATAANGAANGTYTLNLGTSAKAQNGVDSIVNSNGTPNDWSSLTSLAAAGNVPADPGDEFDVTVGGELVSITITGTTTISDVVTTFNSTSTKGVMSAVNIGTAAAPNYVLMVSSLSTGATDGTVSIAVGGDFAGVSTTGAPQAASDATFDVNGVATGIVRSTNTVTDVVPGVTFNILSNPSVATDVTLTISDDVAATTSKVQDFIDAWNDIVSFIKEKNTVTREDNTEGASNIFAALAKTSVDNDALSALRSALSSTHSSNGTAVNIMADLGITTQEDGTLKFDTDTLADAIATESSSVNSLLTTFSDTASLTGGTIDRYTGFNRMFDVVTNSNKQRITDMNQRIADIESRITKSEQAQRTRYAALESTIGQLQSQQSQLTSALAGLS